MSEQEKEEDEDEALPDAKYEPSIEDTVLNSLEDDSLPQPTSAINSFSAHPYNVEDVVQTNEHLDIHQLNQWDYPVFALANEHPECILSLVCTKISVVLKKTNSSNCLLFK